VNFIKLHILVLFITSVFSHFNTFAADASDVETFTLNNGMKILVVEDHSIPNANMYIFWEVGSRNESPGTTGLAHFFEHMMFNGAKKYGPKQFDRTMEGAGGANNAFTTEDITVYSNWFPVDALELIFDLEADRIQNLTLDPKVIESERGVVTSERQTRLENSNFRFLSQEVQAAAYRAHPYSWPVIGHESDIANWSIQDLKAFYQTYYAPNNATVVISGAVETAQIKKLAKKYFEPIPRGEPPQKVHTVEPPQLGERRVYVEKPSVSSPNLLMVFHVPESSHPDYYALTLLSDILTSGDSARLTKNLVFDEQVATTVFSFYPESIDPGLFYIYAAASQQTPYEKVEKAIVSQLNRIMRGGIDERELQKAKNQKLVDFYRSISTIDGKAESIGNYELYFGSYEKFYQAPASFEEVSVDDIKRVANKYLRKKNRTVGILSKEEDSHETDL
jgi:predicted Zn-dependent peptidase